ncbi:hypothetical protein WN48_00861 [Eufriesea mexicana]|nr:hypothetical protein WN48_00861 [Eufriesea mexicana]
MLTKRKNTKYIQNYDFPPTKLRNVFCIQCKHQFFFQEFVPFRGVIPLLLSCGHVICDKCTKSFLHKPCPQCNTISRCESDQNFSLPLNVYTLGLMVMSHNRPLNTDDVDISFHKSVSIKSKQQSIEGLCHECGIQAAIKCPQCIALFCHNCYSKIHGKALQNHSKIMLTENDNENTFVIRNTCSERCNESVGYYCENCDIAGCSHCMLRLHQKHNYQPLIKKVCIITNANHLLLFQLSK